MPRISSYATGFKQQVIELAETDGNRGAARHLVVDKGNVIFWRGSESQLYKMAKSKPASRNDAPFYGELESKLIDCIIIARVPPLAP